MNEPNLVLTYADLKWLRAMDDAMQPLPVPIPVVSVEKYQQAVDAGDLALHRLVELHAKNRRMWARYRKQWARYKRQRLLWRIALWITWLTILGLLSHWANTP